jgi:hypothetical protein
MNPYKLAIDDEDFKDDGPLLEDLDDDEYDYFDEEEDYYDFPEYDDEGFYDPKEGNFV